jgi:hypothetical protein
VWVFEHFCRHFRAVSILFHVWVPSAHISICGSAVWLLESVSLLSKWLFVNFAHISINVYEHKFALVTGRKHAAAVCLRLFLEMGRVLADWIPPPFRFAPPPTLFRVFFRVSSAAVCLRFFLGAGRVLTDWIPPPFSVHPPPLPTLFLSLFKFLSIFSSNFSWALCRGLDISVNIFAQFQCRFMQTEFSVNASILMHLLIKDNELGVAFFLNCWVVGLCMIYFGIASLVMDTPIFGKLSLAGLPPPPRSLSFLLPNKYWFWEN